MFKDKVKVTVVALVMVLLMVLSITTDLFVGLADVFRAKAEEATPTDKGKVILTHNDDSKDLNEEFYTPEMHSNAIDVDTLTKMSKTSKTAKFKDTVDIKNLSTATQYTLQSIAVDTATGLAYKDASGKSHSLKFTVIGHISALVPTLISGPNTPTPDVTMLCMPSTFK